MTPSKIVSYEEWRDMPEVRDMVEEVVDGEIRLYPPYKFKHALLVNELTDRLSAYLDRPRWFVCCSPIGLIIRKSPLTCRVPHVAVFERSRIVEEDGFIHSAPALVVDVLSAQNPDPERKLADYSSLDVLELWRFSLEARTVEVLLVKDGRLQTDRILPQSAILTATTFPEIGIDLASIWPD